MAAEVATVRGLRAAGELIRIIRGRSVPKTHRVSVARFIGSSFQGRFAKDGEEMTRLQASMRGAGLIFSNLGEENFPVV